MRETAAEAVAEAMGKPVDIADRWVAVDASGRVAYILSRRDQMDQSEAARKAERLGFRLALPGESPVIECRKISAGKKLRRERKKARRDLFMARAK